MPSPCTPYENSVNIDDVYKLLHDERQSVDGLIVERLRSNVVLINQISHYIINSGGKRLRPMILLLTARAFGYSGTDHFELAAVVEFIHTATLLHDDVVDASELRRGAKTANNIWGNEASVLVGDFLYSRAFQMMVSIGDMRIMEILSESTNTIAEGEVKQLLNVHNADLTEEDYFAVIRDKTAKLFESAAQLGATLNKRSREEVTSLAAYGMHLGIAFQLIDDALDYSSTADDLGKNIGDDLIDGKATLPIIHALQQGSPTQVAVIRKALESGSGDELESIQQTIEATHAIDYTTSRAETEAQKAIGALSCLPDSEYKEALISIALFAVARNY